MTIRAPVFLAIIIIALFLLPEIVNAEVPAPVISEVTSTAILDVDLPGIAPTERTDGSLLPLSEIAGFAIYCGTEPGTYPGRQYFPMVLTSTEFTINKLELPAGTSYCVVTTIDKGDRESGHSNVVTFDVDAKSPPGVVTGLPKTVIKIMITIEN